MGIAAGLWLARRRLGRRGRAIAAARAGTLGENGWITLDDGSATFRASPDLAVAAGRVLLVQRGVAGRPAGAYRSEGSLSGAEIVAGTRQSLEALLRARRIELDALGLVAVLLTTAPLVTAWATGLLG